MCRKLLAALTGSLQHCWRKFGKFTGFGPERKVEGRQAGDIRSGYLRIILECDLPQEPELALAPRLQSQNCHLLSEICFTEGVV